MQPKKSTEGGGVASLMSGATSLLLSTASGAGSSPTRVTVPNVGGGAWGGIKKAKVKALYSAWLMRLRVRAYMAGLRVTDDLDRLLQLSHRAEPGGAASKEATPTPTPVLAASLSHPPSISTTVVGGKPTFVAESPPSRSQLPLTPPQAAIISTAAAMVPTSTATATISSHRSIFGNQSIEDARKLIALQERTSRRRMRMCAVPTYPLQQQYHHHHQQLLHPQQYCHHGMHYQHYLSNGIPAYASDQRMGQRGRYMPPTTANVYHLQLHQQHQQYRQHQQQTSAMAAAQWVARQQQMALPSQQRSKFHSPPPPPPHPPPPPPQHSMPPKQPPTYDYAMVLKMQQQQQQQQQQMRCGGGFIRRSSEPPPRGGVGGPPMVTSPALVHRHTSPQGIMPRPPLPSYHEVNFTTFPSQLESTLNLPTFVYLNLSGCGYEATTTATTSTAFGRRCSASATWTRFLVLFEIW